MASSLDVAARIMADDLFRLNVVSQNLANANTTGYKKELVSARPFVEYLQAGMKLVPVNLPSLSTAVDPRPGSLTPTGNALDLAVDGQGYFELAGADGPVYTRHGAFSLDAAGRLVTAAGLPVTGLGGEIVLNGPQPSVDRQGRVLEGERVMGQLKIVNFADPAALEPLGGGLYRAQAPGEPLQDNVQLKQGFLESSNVVTLSEVTLLIALVRRFEAAQRLVQGYDGMLGGAIRTLGTF
jgi:flagellar basal body rod protein FlgG